ncbi:hypothetical protein LJR066_002635 [Acidovorax sp. LjRoot66]|uniref:hypothetical protein n=1 Tax=Acidovorax sp. LjRoot66 TaxID=3342334 RepID=UPI003ED0D69C
MSTLGPLSSHRRTSQYRARDVHSLRDFAKAISVAAWRQSASPLNAGTSRSLPGAERSHQSSLKEQK